MIKKIKLKSHDGSDNYLESYQVGDKTVYKLYSQHSSVRVCKQDDVIEFIDPSGGPMINVGCILPCYLEKPPIVKTIFHVSGKDSGLYTVLEFPSE